MNYWDILPSEVQHKILRKKMKLEYSDVMKHFKQVCTSLDARFAAHNRVQCVRRQQCESTVYAHSYLRPHAGFTTWADAHTYLGYRITRMNPSFFNFDPYTDTCLSFHNEFFGSNVIENRVENRGRNEALANGNPFLMSLRKAVKLINTREFTVEHLITYLKANNIKVRSKDRKIDLIQKFMAL